MCSDGEAKLEISGFDRLRCPSADAGGESEPSGRAPKHLPPCPERPSCERPPPRHGRRGNASNAADAGPSRERPRERDTGDKWNLNAGSDASVIAKRPASKPDQPGRARFLTFDVVSYVCRCHPNGCRIDR